MNTETTTQNKQNWEECLCDEGASGVADKIAKATQLCVDNQRQRFKHNWESELESFMNILKTKHLQMVFTFGDPSELLDWFERYDEQDDEIKLGYIFESMAMNLRLQKDSDQVEMLNEIINRYFSEFWKEKERKEKEKKRIIKEKE